MSHSEAPPSPLAEACQLVSGQAALAKSIGVKQAHIWFWLNKAKKGVPAEYCQAIEDASGVSKHRLRPDIFGPTPAVVA